MHTRSRSLSLVLVPSFLLFQALAATAEEVSVAAEDYFQKGRVSFQEGRLVESIREYEHAVTLSPSHVSAWFNLGLAYLKTSDLKHAARCFQTVLRLRPNDAEAHYNLAVVYLYTTKNEA